MSDPMEKRHIQRKKLAEHPRVHGMRGNDSILERERMVIMVIYSLVLVNIGKEFNE